MNKFCKELSVPSEAVPSLLGHYGTKLKDTELASNSKIHVKKTSDILSFVKISAPSILSLNRAEHIIKISVYHYIAATENIEGLPLKSSPCKLDAKMDVRVFWAELNKYT